MAVLVEGISVISKVSSIHTRFRGGWGRFRDTCPNKTLCSDNELARVGFMSPADTQAFVAQLEQDGLSYLEIGRARDLVVVDQRQGFAAPCDWAEFGRINWNHDPNKQVAACRLTGSQQQDLFYPDGWEYENSLSSQLLFVGEGWVPEFMNFLRHEQGMDVYRDLRTGKEVYVGRSLS